MKKHFVFFHQNFPGQFGPIASFLVKEGAKVSFFSEYCNESKLVPGVNHYFYKPDNTFQSKESFFFSKYFEAECRSMYGALQAFQKARINSPDVFVGHAGFGSLGLLHMAYPKIPTIGFFELFYEPLKPETYTRKEYSVPSPNLWRMPLRNATHLVELEYCTKAYSPTKYQKSTFPTVYQDKIQVFFDGINTDFYAPGDIRVNSELKGSWPPEAKIITYVARGLEALRGFDIFMEAAYELSLKRTDVHFVIAGNPQTHYGPEMLTLKEKTFKEYVLKKRSYDLSRFHFLNWISERELLDLFRISDCHFYWTIPYVLSWSFFQAMSVGCLVLASRSAPVCEVIEENTNGLLFEPYAVEEIVEKILEALDRQDKYLPLRKNARQTIIDKYSYSVCLPKLAEFYLA